MRTHRTRSLTIILGALCVLSLFALGVNQAHAATNRYVNPDGVCGGQSPCYTNLNAAGTAAGSGDTIIVLANLPAGGSFNIATTNLTFKGTTPAITINGSFSLTQSNGWTIKDFNLTGSIVATTLNTSLTIDNVHVNGINIAPTGDLNANITITNNTFFASYDEITILGANGHSVSGTYIISNNTGEDAINVLAMVGPAGPANMNANVTLDGNTIAQRVQVGVYQSGSNAGTGTINGNVVMNNNTVLLKDDGLNIALEGPNVTGAYVGNMTITNNHADKIAAGPTDSVGPCSGNIVITGNIAENIEIGILGNFTGNTVNVQNNNLTYKSSQFNAAITVTAYSFASNTAITIANNTGNFAVVVSATTGADNASVTINNNSTTFFINVDAKTLHSKPITITNNVNTGTDPLPNASVDGYITIRSQGSTVAGGTLAGNKTPNVQVTIATTLTANLDFTNNTISKIMNVQSASSGTGIVNMTGNRFGTVASDQMAFVSTRSEVHFNSILGKAATSNNALNHFENNWWGCNAGAGTAPCTTALPGNTEPHLVLTTNALCSTINTKIIPAFHLTKNNVGTSLAGVTAPGTATVTSSSGSVVTPNVPLVNAMGSTVVNVAGGASPNITVTLDRQAMVVSRSCTTRKDTIGAYRQSTGEFLLRNSNSSGAPDNTVVFGGATSLPVAGDWNNDGIDTIGVYNTTSGFFSLRDTNTGGVPDYNVLLGNPGDMPLQGRWDASMTGDGVGVFRPSNGIIYLKRALTNGYSDYFMVLGNPGDAGFAGDWDGNGFSGPGIYRPSQGHFYLSNNGTANGIIYSDLDLSFGDSGDRSVVGDWIGDGTTGIGVFRPSLGMFLLRNATTTGNPDYSFAYGDPTDLPVAGYWQVGNAPPPASGVLVPGGASQPVPGSASDGPND